MCNTIIAIYYIEAELAKNKEHSFNHENRMSRMWEKSSAFGDEVVTMYHQIERNQRNKVAYRGENGEKYRNIKQLALLLTEKYDQQI